MTWAQGILQQTLGLSMAHVSPGVPAQKTFFINDLRVAGCWPRGRDRGHSPVWGRMVNCPDERSGAEIERRRLVGGCPNVGLLR